MPKFSHVSKAVIIGFLLCTTLAACNTTASLQNRNRSADPIETQRKQWQDNPGNPDIAIGYAKELGNRKRLAESASVLEVTAMRFPNHKGVLSAYGKALLAIGRLDEASRVLANAHSPQDPDWTILSAQGVIADQQGNHERARKFYDAALRISPDNPAILANLGLSYLLTQQPAVALDYLSRAASHPGASPKVHENLELARSLAPAKSPPAQPTPGRAPSARNS